MVRTAILWVLIAVAIGWGTAILAAPLARESADQALTPRLAALTYVIGALVCHQRPERSFHLAGAQLPVCARCAALYGGGAVGLVGWLLVRIRISRDVTRRLFMRALVVSSVPIVVTLATSAIGLWDPANAFRAIASAPFGIALGGLLAAVVLEDLR
jgi:uncharacterized membrane protein